MRFHFICAPLVIFLLLFNSIKTYSQVVTDSSKPSIHINAGFDVIIKKNGDIVYGLVKEVTQEIIKYQRTDIPDGPIYTIPRSDVFAISYRNQVKDILNPLPDPQLGQNKLVAPDTSLIIKNTSINKDTVAKHDTTPLPNTTAAKIKQMKKNWRDGTFRAGFGIFRSYTKVSQVSQYTSSVNFPIINLAYEVRYNQNVFIGIQVAFGPHKFSNDVFSGYDSTQTKSTLKENIFMLDVYGKYMITYHTDKVQPYIIGGIGIHSSHISTAEDIAFVSHPDNELLVNSGNNAVGLGLIARIGAEYFINPKVRLYGDAGFGATILNFGVCIRVN